jgi:hypothetical protein
MKTTMTSLAIVVLWCGAVLPRAHAQKGMGERTGVARSVAKPEVVSLSGKVLATETGPCEKTTGKAVVGSHFLLETAEGKMLNIHLGPADAVDYIVKQLIVGKEVTVRGFRTAKMPQDHYVAQSVAFGETTVQLRDEGLRPFWAQGSGLSRGRGGPGYARGPGWRGGRGYGRGLGWRRGWGRGRGWAARCGRGFGPR